VPIRILIADDHAIVRSGLKQILATASDLDVVGEAGNGEQVLAQARILPLDLILLDLTMPGISGTELLSRLRTECPAIPVLVLTMHNVAQVAAQALRAGASGFLTKDSEPEVLIGAIRKVAGGGRFIDPKLVDAIIFDGERLVQAPHKLLSARELQILRLIAGGISINDIAENLHLSPKTVSTHKKRIMRKLGVASNAELYRYAIGHGIGA